MDRPEIISKEEAIKKAEEYLKTIKCELEVQILEVSEFKYGWLFYYQSVAFMETNDMRTFLVGNSPFIINKYDGSLVVTGTVYPPDYYLKKYIKEQEEVDGQ